MAIDTKVQVTLKIHKHKNMRRGGSPEPSCQLPTAPAHSCLIPLTQGQFAIVDAKNYEWLNQWKWHLRTSKRTDILYASSFINKQLILMHRLILSGRACKRIRKEIEIERAIKGD